MRSQLRSHFKPALGLFAAAWLLAAAGAAAQQTGAITGQVRAAESGQLLSSVQVFIQDLSLGGLSQANGRYLLQNVPAGTYTLSVQLIGYRTMTRTVAVAAGQTVVENFDLAQQALSLDEIVVTGTAGGTQVRAIGNVVERVDVSTRTEAAPVTNINQLLSAQTPGTQMLGLSANVGTGTVIRIRGTSSLTLGSNPLLYVDGIRVDNAYNRGPNLRGGGQSTRMNDFNPEDIQSIEIIKGPAAATLYGTEASNGVIQIITKKGASGSPSLDFVVRQGLNWISNPAERFFTTYSYQCRQNPYPYNCTAAQIKADAGTLDSMNIYEEYERRTGHGHYSNGPIREYSAAVRGGTDVIRYYGSVGWDDETGVVDYNWNKKLSTRANIGVTPNAMWDMNLSLGYIDSETRFAQAATGLDLYSLIIWTSANTRSGTTQGHRYSTPENIAKIDSHEDVHRFTGSFQVTHRPFEWLSHRMTVGIDQSAETASQLFPRTPAGPCWRSDPRRC